jgi:hypothetical protein
VCVLGDVGGVDDVTGVAYNGSNMTLAIKSGFDGTGFFRYMYLYYLLNPTAGSSQNVVVSASTTHYLFALAADYSGATTIPDGTNSAYVYNNTLTLAVTPTSGNTNDWTVLCGTANISGATAGTGVTKRVEGAAFAQPALFDSGGVIGTSGAYSMTINSPSGTNMSAAASAFEP